MTGRVEDGELVTVEPAGVADVDVGDVVLCKVKGRPYLHLVKSKDGDRVLIGNNHGRINGWTRRVYGKLTPH